MYIFFLYFHLNKYFLGSFFNFIKFLKSIFFNLFYLIEYIFLFVFNFYFFYFLILFKFLIKEKFILKKKIKDFKYKSFDNKSEKTKKIENKSRIQLYLNKFWYYYYRRWMYKGWFLFFIGMKRWELRQFKYYLIYVYHNRIKRRFILFKDKILGSFFTFFAFNNFFLVRFYKNLRESIFFTIYFLICLKMYSITFLKIKLLCIFRRVFSFFKNREFKQVRVWFKVKKK